MGPLKLPQMYKLGNRQGLRTSRLHQGLNIECYVQPRRKVNRVIVCKTSGQSPLSTVQDQNFDRSRERY